MQLIWVSGPTAQVVTWSITRRKVLVALGLMAGFFVLLGGLFQLVGLRVAIEHAPSLAFRMGGIASLQEQQRVEAHYGAQLGQLQQQLAQTVRRLQELEAGRQAFFSRIGLGALTPDTVSQSKRDGRGGPFKAVTAWTDSAAPLPERMDEASLMLQDVHRLIEQTHKAWATQQRKLEALPLALPLQSEFLLTSTFGVRSDPMTHGPSMHEGIDFVAPVGTPVVAAAAGQVVQARYNGAYGNMVEVAHAEGFVTRYAHLKTIDVGLGQSIGAGERLGQLGNTGRSTGPHLHYEVIFRGQAMHPVKAVQKWSRS